MNFCHVDGSLTSPHINPYDLVAWASVLLEAAAAVAGDEE
jgi:hypothetical protein